MVERLSLLDDARPCLPPGPARKWRVSTLLMVEVKLLQVDRADQDEKVEGGLLLHAADDRARRKVMVQAATGNPLQLIAAERLSELGRDTREELTKLPDVVLIPHGRWHAEQIAVLGRKEKEIEAARRQKAPAMTKGVSAWQQSLDQAQLAKLA